MTADTCPHQWHGVYRIHREVIEVGKAREPLIGEVEAVSDIEGGETVETIEEVVIEVTIGDVE